MGKGAPPAPHRRAQLLSRSTPTGGEWCRAFSDATDEWLRDLFRYATADVGADKVALVAVGGYGRRELAPSSDLDVLLLHGGRRDVKVIAERIWYPIWDSKTKLGHGVHTVKEALSLASNDLDTATAQLSARHLAGDASLTEALIAGAHAQWRKRADRWIPALAAAVDRRHQLAGEVAFLLEPDLKDGRGGLRDVHCLQWAEAARMVLLPGDQDALRRAYSVLLSARVELHRRTGRPGDVLLLQDQDSVAAALEYRDADALMAAVSSAARTIAWTSDETWQRVRSKLKGPAGRRFHRDHPVSPGVVLREGEVHIEAGASPEDDPALVLRAAGAAARHRTRIDRASLDLLAARTPVFPEPWPVGARDALVSLLLEGHHAIGPIEALDQRGLLVKILPEWAPVRSKPQRNAYHRFTVDRHLLEAAANAAELVDRVSRPDLLVVGALLHDLGKGYPGDHTERGIELVERIAPRMGFEPPDVEVLADMVRYHLLLPDVATRRDLTDDVTIHTVAKAVGSARTLELLHALTEADSIATSNAAWGSWKAELVDDLVARCAHVLGGGELAEVTWSLFPSAEVLELMGAHRTSLRLEDWRLTVVAPDRPGLFGRVAGVLTLHGLDVLDARAHSDEHGMAASEFRVAPPDRDHPARPEGVLADLERALDGRLALEARLEERARVYGERQSARRKRAAAFPAARSVAIHNDASSNATVVEVRAPNAMGVLYRITRALAEMQLDIRHAKVQTLGHEVVDSFYVRDAHGRKVTDSEHLREIERAILYQLSLV